MHNWRLRRVVGWDMPLSLNLWPRWPFWLKLGGLPLDRLYASAQAGPCSAPSRSAALVMEPTPAAMAGITTFGALLEWASIEQDGTFWKAVSTYLGQPRTSADIAGIASAELDTVLSGIRISRLEADPLGPGENMPISVVERSRLRRLWAGAQVGEGRAPRPVKRVVPHPRPRGGGLGTKRT